VAYDLPEVRGADRVGIVRKMRKVAVIVGAFGLTMYVTLLLAGKALESFVWEDYQRFRAIRVGMTEAEVRNALGEPQFVYEGATAPVDYYVKGYSFEQRPISGRVLIYVGGEPIAYIYTDRTGKVEHVFVGGS
jgi:hypothetical protein